jgi:hypothetical protein
MVLGGCVTQRSMRSRCVERHRPRGLVVSALVVLLGLVAACGSDDPDRPAFVEERASSLPPGSVAPAPADPVVLEVVGRITRPNDGSGLRLDLATLEQLRIVSYDADDAQAEGGIVRFRGVLLADVLALAGATDYRELAMTALNDYEVVIPRADVDRHAVMIATSANGRRMTVETYGPTRIVYPNLTSELSRSTYDQRWIWQLEQIEVR